MTWITRQIQKTVVWMATFVLVLLLSQTGHPWGDHSIPLLHGYSGFSNAGPVSTLMSSKEIAKVLSANLRGTRRSNAPSLAAHLLALCRNHQFDPAFILSLIKAESSFNAKAVSPVGALGLMQVMPPTAEFIAARIKIPYKGPEALKDPYVNLTLGVAYLAYLRDRYNGRVGDYLAAYNVGPTRFDRLERDRVHRWPVVRKYINNIRSGVALMKADGAEERRRESAQNENPGAAARKAG